MGGAEVQYDLHEQLQRVVGPQHRRADQQEAVSAFYPDADPVGSFLTRYLASDLAEIEVEGQHDTGIDAGALDEFGIRRALLSQRANMNGMVPELPQEFDGSGRDASVSQKPHDSGAQRVKFVLSQRRRVGDGLADVVCLEIRQFLDDFGR